MVHLGRMLIVMGCLLVLLGFMLTYGPRLPFRMGELPLDMQIHRGGFSFYFPLGTSIVISIVLTFLYGLMNKR